MEIISTYLILYVDILYYIFDKKENHSKSDFVVLQKRTFRVGHRTS